MSKSFRERITYIDDYFVLRSGWVWLESRIATDINIIISIYVYLYIKKAKLGGFSTHLYKFRNY